MERILVGVDGSAAAEAAADLAVSLARPLGATVRLAYVVPLVAHGAPGMYLAATGWEEEAAQTGNAVLQASQRRLADAQVRTETALEFGHAADVLARLARDWKADLVAVGHRARDAASRVVLGSVADRLAQIAPCPVLIVRR